MNRLDLHGVRHSEANRMLENFLYQHIKNGSVECEVITGNSPEMKAIVEEVIKDYDMTCTEQFGNFGVLIINMK
jgi:DNA-nicking Smr family endonuclease